MFRSYLAIAVRRLLAQKLYTAINVAGLALGLACALLIALFVRHELSYERNFVGNDRIVRISENITTDRLQQIAWSSPAIAPLLVGFFPEIEKAARLRSCFDSGGGALVTVGDRRLLEPRVMAADSDFFEIFRLDWRQGDARTALAKPDSVVLTESTARRFFGDAAALGRTLQAFEGTSAMFVVTGVVADLPDSTHLAFDMLFSLSAWPAEILGLWGGDCFYTYARLVDGADPAAIDERSGEFFNQRFMDGSARIRGFTAVPIRDIHQRSSREGELRMPGSITTVYALGAIAVFVLLIACINFVNLTTARATQRAKEIGIRKSVGGTRAQVIRQFIGESLLLTSIAVVLAVMLVGVSLEPFAVFVEREIGLSALVDRDVIAAIVMTTLLVAIGAGSYPALLLSKFEPVRVLRGGVTRGATGGALRKALVVLQFSISIALVVATLVVFEQQRFASAFDLGYEKDQIVVLTGAQVRGLGAQWQSMRRRLESVPGVEAVTASNVVPGTRTNVRTQVRNLDEDGMGGFLAELMLVDFGFFETYEIDVIDGRSFDEASGDREIARETGQLQVAPASFVFSRLAVERLGSTPDEVIGRVVIVSDRRGVVVGVVEDVHLESVRDPLTPVIYNVPSPERALQQVREASIRVTGADLEGTLAGIDAVWRELGPDVPVVRRFLDEDFEALYRGERRQGHLLTLFSLLAVTISCLGLFGLTSFSTTRRTKEIGIRKACGAGVGNIVALLVVEFGALVVFANLIAWPLAYVFMQRWLVGFAYRIELGPLVFLVSGAVALVIALLAVAAVAGRAARARPVAALRYE